MIPSQDNQLQLNHIFHEWDFMTSCQWLERRFLHSINQFMYLCNDPDDGDGCPKRDRGIVNKGCLIGPDETRLGEDNNEQGDFAEK